MARLPHRARGKPRTIATTTQTRPVPAAVRPRLADGVELIGEYEGSGYKEPPSLARRADGQVIQLTPLLYKVAERLDGQRGLQEIADDVGRDIGRGVSADNVRVLVDGKLRPLGLVTEADGSQPEVAKLDPLLALKFRAGVVPEWLSNGLGNLFRRLFLPPIILGVLAGLVFVDWWVFFHHGVGQAIRRSLYEPSAFLVLFGAVVVSAAFHELGHASACRYGGARPGRMGCGLYLAWPAFYTDVTDAYRLGRRGRLRTDLGGVYFNVIVILATLGAYAATHYEPLLLLIIIQHVEIAHQLLPIVRLDGYYIVADLTGVPDLFNRIGPILRGLAPWRPTDDRVTVLKRWVRIAVTAWVLIVVPLLLFQLFIIVVHLPRIIGTAWDSLGHQADLVAKAWRNGNVLGWLTSAVQIVVLVLPVLGIILMIVRLAQRTAAWLWRSTDGRPVLRTAATAVLLAAGAAVASSWLPREHHYRPIQPSERGTIQQGVASVTPLRSPHTRPVTPAEQRDEHPAVASTTSTTSRSTTTTRPDTTTTTLDSRRDPAGARTGSTTTTTERRSTTTTEPETTTTTRATTTTTAPDAPTTTEATTP